MLFFATTYNKIRRRTRLFKVAANLWNWNELHYFLFRSMRSFHLPFNGNRLLDWTRSEKHPTRSAAYFLEWKLALI
jgi:hypothetical protein